MSSKLGLDGTACMDGRDLYMSVCLVLSTYCLPLRNRVWLNAVIWQWGAGKRSSTIVSFCFASQGASPIHAIHDCRATPNDGMTHVPWFGVGQLPL